MDEDNFEENFLIEALDLLVEIIVADILKKQARDKEVEYES